MLWKLLLFLALFPRLRFDFRLMLQDGRKREVSEKLYVRRNRAWCAHKHEIIALDAWR